MDFMRAGVVVCGLLVPGGVSFAQTDYTPGFDAGPQEEMAPLEHLVGEWDIQLYYPARDDTVDAGWAWQEWAESHAVISSRMGGVALFEQNQGFPLGPSSVGVEGFEFWSYDTHFSYDLVQQTHRVVVIDNLWGLADIYEGDFTEDGGSVSNLRTGTNILMGRDGGPQKALIRIRDIDENSFVLEWWSLDGSSVIDGSVDDQAWEPSVRMEYVRRS